MSFIRTKEIPPGSGNYYEYEVESYRDGDSVRQRVIRYIGRAGGKRVSANRSQKPEKVSEAPFSLGILPEVVEQKPEAARPELVLYRGISDKQKNAPTYLTDDVGYARNFGKDIYTVTLSGNEKIADFTTGAIGNDARLAELGLTETEIVAINKAPNKREAQKQALKSKGFDLLKYYDEGENGKVSTTYNLLYPDKYTMNPIASPKPEAKPDILPVMIEQKPEAKKPVTLGDIHTAYQEALSAKPARTATSPVPLVEIYNTLKKNNPAYTKEQFGQDLYELDTQGVAGLTLPASTGTKSLSRTITTKDKQGNEKLYFAIAFDEKYGAASLPVSSGAEVPEQKAARRKKISEITVLHQVGFMPGTSNDVQQVLSQGALKSGTGLVFMRPETSRGLFREMPEYSNMVDVKIPANVKLLEVENRKDLNNKTGIMGNTDNPEVARKIADKLKEMGYQGYMRKDFPEIAILSDVPNRIVGRSM